MPIQVVTQFELIVGHETVIDGAAPEGPNAAVFEDDGQTGYFYAIERSQEQITIRDALHVYNVDAVTDRENRSVAKIAWSTDNKRVVLLINDYPQAIFDFHQKRGFCRLGFPPAKAEGQWSSGGHEWDGNVITLLEWSSGL